MNTDGNAESREEVDNGRCGSQKAVRENDKVAISDEPYLR